MEKEYNGNPQRLLTCPSCQCHFAYRYFLRSRACPSCEVSLGFSVPYRIGLAIFAIAVFLYCSYKAVLSASFVLSVVGLILAAPLALIARLFFISNVPLHLHAIGIARCPICDGVLTRVVIRDGPFDCPHCLKQIRPIHRLSYRWARRSMRQITPRTDFGLVLGSQYQKPQVFRHQSGPAMLPGLCHLDSCNL